jgi:predicted Zn finger-like uncharacterized protein
MIVICEDCGRKYKINPAKINNRAAKFKCKNCSHLIVINPSGVLPHQPDPPSGTGIPVLKERAGASDPGIEAESTASDSPERDLSLNEAPAPETDVSAPHAVTGKGPPTSATLPNISKRRKKFGLRSKMYLLFLLLPILLFGISTWMFMQRLSGLETSITELSSRVVSGMAEEQIAEISRAVARQCQLYLMSQSGLKKENFDKDTDFKRLAVQKIGLTGYTALYQLPDKSNVWRTWSHIDPKIVGIDMATLKNTLGKHFDGFWKIFTGVADGKESRGYYTWQNPDGMIKRKFMVCTPIEETRFVIAATTYVEELTLPLNQLKANIQSMTRQVRKTLLTILLVTILVIGLVVALYGHKLAARIRKLTQIADRISVGDMDAKINARSGDEIGELAGAIERMQESIRLSIERLRNRK